MPPQPANHGTGNGLLGVLPASSLPPPSSQAMAYADPSRSRPAADRQQNGAIKPVAVHTGWIIQVGALESESEARQRIEARAHQARGLLARPIHLPNRSSPKATGSCSGPVSPGSTAIRPKRYAGPEALRHLLHHRSKLIAG